jgi:hypothetical protein
VQAACRRVGEMVEVTDPSGYAVSWSTPSLRVFAASATCERESIRPCRDRACSFHCAIPSVHQRQARPRACGSAFCRPQTGIGMAFQSVSWRHSGAPGAVVSALLVNFGSRSSEQAHCGHGCFDFCINRHDPPLLPADIHSDSSSAPGRNARKRNVRLTSPCLFQVR